MKPRKLVIIPAEPKTALTLAAQALEFVIETNASEGFSNSDWNKELRGAGLTINALKQQLPETINFISQVETLAQQLEESIMPKVTTRTSKNIWGEPKEKGITGDIQTAQLKATLDTIMTELHAALNQFRSNTKTTGPEPAFLKELRKRSLVSDADKLKAKDATKPAGLAGQIAEVIQSRPQPQVGLLDNIFSNNQAYGKGKH